MLEKEKLKLEYEKRVAALTEERNLLELQARLPTEGCCVRIAGSDEICGNASLRHKACLVSGDSDSLISPSPECMTSNGQVSKRNRAVPNLNLSEVSSGV